MKGNKSKQFSGGSGQREKGFTQKTPKTVTAAMQGRSMQGGPVKAKPKNSGSKQFQSAPGKKVF